MEAKDYRAKSDSDLNKELIELRKEQFNLRMQRGSGQLSNTARFGQVRKEIARIKTIMNEKAKASND